MRRVVLLFVGGLLAVAPMLGSGTPAGASPARSSVVSGSYTVYVNWLNGGWQPAGDATLKKNHHGTDAFGDSATWSVSGKTITITWSNAGGVAAVYVGTTNRMGISSLKHPGTTSTPGGANGVWYALKSS